MQKLMTELDFALLRLKKGYAQFDTFGTTYAVLYSPHNENDLNLIEDAARKYSATPQPARLTDGEVEGLKKSHVTAEELQLVFGHVPMVYYDAVQAACSQASVIGYNTAIKDLRQRGII